MIVFDSVKKKHLCICFTLLLKLNSVISGTVKAIKTNLEVPVNQTAQLQWRVVPDVGEEIAALKVFDLESHKVPLVLATTLASDITTAGKAMFGNRLFGSLSNDVYTLSIKKIKFNEKKSFKLDVIFISQSEGYVKSATLVIKEVVGGPEACGISLNTNYAVNEGKQLSVTTEVCGNPKPVLTWKLQKELEYSYSTEVAPVNISIMRYRYVYKTRRLVTRADCGTKLVFNATGANGMIKGETLIDVTLKRLDTKKLVLAIIIALVVTQVANICIYGVEKYRGAETNC